LVHQYSSLQREDSRRAQEIQMEIESPIIPRIYLEVDCSLARETILCGEELILEMALG